MSTPKPLYGAVGAVITNDILYCDGSSITNIKGGSAYALEGLKLWTDDCFMVAKVGLDFEKYYGEWYSNNGIPRTGITPVDEVGIYNRVTYNADGSYTEAPVFEDWDSYQFHFGHMTVDHTNLLNTCQTAKGYYIGLAPNRAFWSQVAKLKQQYGFAVMWEIVTADCIPQNLAAIKECLAGVDMFSLNMHEACCLFETEDEEECIRLVQQLPVAFTLLRAGEEGLYTVTPNRVAFVPIRRYDGPVQDPTGCGNSSTAAALWAWCQGYDDIMIGLIANTTAYYNVQQFGPMEHFDTAIREKELAYLKKEREKYPQ